MPLSLPSSGRIVAATHNPGKAVELAALLDGRFEVVAAGALNIPEPDETEATFTGNALLKARHAAKASGLISLADDSGLCVAALGGDPGVLSARWAGPSKDFTMAMAEIEKRMRASGADDDRAYFACALAIAWPDGPAVVVEGRVDGRLSFPPRGGRGFGYDPIFIADGYERTFAEIDPAEKHAISHRADAFAKLKAAVF